jgi:glutaminyl-peptide cyclotransferase
MKNKILYVILFALIIASPACRIDQSGNEKPVDLEISEVIVPEFNADSAYFIIQKQVAFGPRIPNTRAHLNCGDYLIGKLKNYDARVVVQEFQEPAYSGEILNLRNIIASFNPDQSKRILLAAHWDTRPMADKDATGMNGPIDGANDGASGVGVLLEIARILSLMPPKDIGVDIILFDGEDYGEPDTYPSHALSEPGKIWWCLGSQYWSNNKHVPNYMAYYGILLDMVGAKNAHFYKEGGSMQYAGRIVNKVWKAAAQIGYQNYFIQQNSPGITDDHIFINRNAKIPTIDIVDYDPGSEDSDFPFYQHTHSDNLSLIDTNTLKAVGQTLMYVLYHE